MEGDYRENTKTIGNPPATHTHTQKLFKKEKVYYLALQISIFTQS